MFGNKLEAAKAQISTLSAMLAATGFKVDAEAGTLPTVADFSAHLEARDTAAAQKAAKPIEAAKIEALAKSGAFTAAFAAAGVALPELAAADFVAPKEGAAAPAVAKIQAALETALAKRSAKQIAAAGHPAAVDVPSGEGAGDASAADAVPANKADFHATWTALKKSDPKAAAAYFRKHEAKFPVR